MGLVYDYIGVGFGPSNLALAIATEEFGIAAVEALAAGRPVIALADGGVRESVTEGETGTFFERPEPGALAEAVARFDALGVDPAVCRASAERFSAERFRATLAGIVDDAVRDERAPRPDERPPNRGLAGVPVRKRPPRRGEREGVRPAGGEHPRRAS